MLSKTIIATAALAATVAAYDLPTCWTSCFEEYEVESEGCLCKDALGSVVSKCIASGCETADSEAYASWLASYCYEAPVSSNTWPVPSTTYAVPSSSAPPVYSSVPPPVYTQPAESSKIPSEPPVYTTPVESSPVESSPVESYPVESTPYTSICTESTTLIWRSSTAVVPVTITHAPGGGWATYPAGNSSAAATPTGYGAPQYSGVPATGGAARVGAGLAVLAGGVAAVLL